MEREFFFPGFLRCQRMSRWTTVPFRLFADQNSFGVVAGIYNSGRHLYWDGGWPRFYDAPLQFLRYLDFYGGRKIGAATVSHYGHLLGVGGGRANVSVERLGLTWHLNCLPNEFWYVIEVGLTQAVFKIRQPLSLPIQVLPFGR